MAQITHEQIRNDIYDFKSDYDNLHNLIKIFIHEYYNFFEDGNYIENNEYISKNCLYALIQSINIALNKSYQNIAKIYHDFELSEYKNL